MRARVSVRREECPVAIALPSPDGIRGAVNRARLPTMGIERHLCWTLDGMFGQGPDDALFRRTLIWLGADLYAVIFAHG
jgi:hypothetical protein